MRHCQVALGGKRLWSGVACAYRVRATQRRRTRPPVRAPERRGTVSDWLVQRPRCLAGWSRTLMACVAGLQLSLNAPGASAAQTSIDLPGAVSCRSCRVTLDPLATLGDSTGAGMLEAEINNVVRDTRGRYFISDGQTPHIWVFDGRGTTVTRLGRQGSGPGEYRRPTAFLVGPGDSLHVFDASLSRMTVYAPDLTVARTEALEFRPDLYDGAVVGRRLVINASIRTAERAGLPLHLLGPSGGILRSFGSATGVYRPDLGYGIRRSVTAGHGGSVWAAELNTYVLQQWDTAGRLLRTIQREVEWFPTLWSYDINAASPPPPSITALLQSGDTLWAMVKVADRNWRSAVESASPDGRFFKVSDQNEYRDTMLEAIDTRSGRVVVSARIPELLWGFIGPGTVYGPGTDEAGNPVVKIYGARVARN